MALTVFITAMIEASAPAQEREQANGIVAVVGSGTDSCAKFLSATDGHKLQIIGVYTALDGNKYFSENALYLEWIKGFISSFNMLHDSMKIDVDNWATELWIRNWCNKHPTERLVTAADQFIHAHTIAKSLK